MQPSRVMSFFFVCSLAGWVVALGLGAGRMASYASTPGAPGTPPASWPAESAIERSPGGATLVFFAHPRCPCTRASVSELARIVARCEGRLAPRVIFVEPEGVASDWSAGGTWRAAERIPGTFIERDRGGAEARRFGARTSGTALLYDARGNLLFQGGITAARGEAGDNNGAQAVVELARGERDEPASAPVLGCPLFEPEVQAKGVRQ